MFEIFQNLWIYVYAEHNIVSIEIVHRRRRGAFGGITCSAIGQSTMQLREQKHDFIFISHDCGCAHVPGIGVIPKVAAQLTMELL